MYKYYTRQWMDWRTWQKVKPGNTYALLYVQHSLMIKRPIWSKRLNCSALPSSCVPAGALPALCLSVLSNGEDSQLSRYSALVGLLSSAICHPLSLLHWFTPPVIYVMGDLENSTEEGMIPCSAKTSVYLRIGVLFEIKIKHCCYRVGKYV